jgi:aminotransferase
MAQISRRMLSAKAEQFTESVIREMTRLALKHGAVNLSQGFPDFAAPEEIKEAARQATTTSTSTPSLGAPLRGAIVEKSSAPRASGTIRSARSPFAAARPRR